MTERLSGIIHLRPDGNSEYTYPFNRRPTNNNQYDQYGRPFTPYQNSPNHYPQYQYQDQYTRPVQFPNSRPYQDQYNNQNQEYYQYPSRGNLYIICLFFRCLPIYSNLSSLLLLCIRIQPGFNRKPISTV